MNELILLSLILSLSRWWWSDSYSRDGTVQLAKTTTSASWQSSLLSCLTPKDNYELKALSRNAISKTSSLLLQNLFWCLCQGKTWIKHSLFSPTMLWSQGTRERWTADDTWEGENRARSKIHKALSSASALLLLCQDHSHQRCKQETTLLRHLLNEQLKDKCVHGAQ